MKTAILVLAACLAPAAFAAETTRRDPAPVPWKTVSRDDVIQLERGPATGRGGELVVYGTRLETPGNRDSVRIEDASLLDTFSVERDEPLDLGVPYTVASVSRTARAGGFGGKAREDGDPIDPRTAYLFEQFYFQRLSDFAYDDHASPREPAAAPSGLRSACAEQLQRALWFLENELEGVDPATGASLRYDYDPTNLDIAKRTLGEDSPAYRWIVEADAATKDPGNRIGNRVRVLTLVDQRGHGIQDVLIVLPECENVPGQVVWADNSTTPAGMSTEGWSVANFSRFDASGYSAPGGGGSYGASFGNPPPPHGPPIVPPKPTPKPGPTPVSTPEPGSLLIWIGAVAAGALWARKRRRSTAPKP
jgi:hypothetical protein